MTFGPARTFGIPTRQPFSNRRERGGALLLFTFMTVLLIIPVIGLAIDGSILFWTKAKLSSAVDAAALAAGRSINVYETQQQNSGPVAAVAQQWFAANFPAGWLGTSVVGGAPTVTIAPTSTMTQTVVVTASATVPLYFMRLLHFSSATVAASAQSSRRNINLVLVLDRSGSMGPAPTGSNACPTMIASAQNFVNLFTDGFDTLGLVTFSTTANSNPIDYAPTTFFKSSSTTLSTKIGQIVCTGATSSAQALHVAYQSIKSTGLAGGLNVIVFFTDGQPNLVVENSWPIKTQTDTRNDPNSWSSTSIGASPCNSSDVLSGGFTTLLASGTVPSNTGYTGGVYSTANTAITTAPGLISASGCKFTSSGSTYARDDVAYIQNTDAYGNITNSGYIGGGLVGSPDKFPSTNTYYKGDIRDDEQIPGVMAAAFAAADYQGQVIRNDTTYNTIIYTIGLDGAPDMGIDQVFLQRLANDPSSPIYDSTRPAGYYAYAADPSALSQAFHEIASQVLRLSK